MSKTEILKPFIKHVSSGFGSWDMVDQPNAIKAMEEYLSEYKQKLKAEIEKEEYQIPNDDFEFGWNKALEKVVLTLIDKI